MVKTLTKGKPAKIIFYFSLPVIAGNLFQLFYTMADTIIVGRTMGADALAAVGSTTVVIYLILCFIQGVTGGYGIVTAQNFGAKNEKGVKESNYSDSCFLFYYYSYKLSSYRYNFKEDEYSSRNLSAFL